MYRLRTSALSLIILVGIGTFAARTVVPAITGTQAVTITTGSMGDALPAGSLAYVARQATYPIGTIVTYHLGAQLVTHRVEASWTDAGGPPLRVKGDRNATADPALVQANQIVGSVVGSIPVLGLVATWLRTPAIVLFLLLLGITLLWGPDLFAASFTAPHHPT